MSLLPSLLLTPALAEEPTHRELRIEMSVDLHDPNEKLWLEPVTLVVPGFEWQTSEGEWTVELLDGEGLAQALGPDGELVEVPLSTHFEVFEGAGYLGQDEGMRRYGLRGDLYLRSPDWELVELDYGLTLATPVEDGELLPPQADLPAGDDEQADVLIAVQIDEMMMMGWGGAGVTEVYGPVWGRPHGRLPFFGVMQIDKVDARASAQSAQARDADRLLGRLLYVKADYAVAVAAEGEIQDEAEYSEQLTLLQEARLIGSHMDLQPSTTQALDDLRDAVVGVVSPESFEARAQELIEAVDEELWLVLEPPRGGDLEQGPALFGEHCASCHGVEGAGPPEAMASLVPAPPAFAESTPGLTPRRAYNSITFGVTGTAMAPYADTLSEDERWALAWQVMRWGVEDPSSGPHLTLEQLAKTPDEGLESAGWSRYGGVQAAAQSPWLELRGLVRQVALGQADVAELAKPWKRLRKPLKKAEPELTKRLEAELAAFVAADPAQRRALALSLARSLAEAEQALGAP
jgi:mono/diheme cytochrome c family protein